MAVNRRRRGGKQNLFGKALDEVCFRTGVTREQIAREAGLNSSTLHYVGSAEKDHRARRETLYKLVDALKRHAGWLDTYKPLLFNAAGQATDEQIAEAARLLDYLKYADERGVTISQDEWDSEQQQQQRQ